MSPTVFAVWNACSCHTYPAMWNQMRKAKYMKEIFKIAELNRSESSEKQKTFWKSII